MASHEHPVPWRGLTLLCLLAVALRLAVVFVLSVPDIVETSESGMTAANMVVGRGYTFDLFGVRQEQPLESYMPPLYPGLLFFCLRFFDHPGLVLGLIQSLLSGMAVLLFYLIGAWLAGDQLVGWLAAIGAAGYPMLVLMSAFPLSLTVDFFLLVIVLWMATRVAQQPTAVWAGLVGAGLGIASLGRPITLGILPCLLVWLALFDKATRARLLVLGAGMTGMLLLVLLPWTVRNYLVQEQFVLISTNGGINFWNGNNPFTTGSGWEVYTERLAHYQVQQPDPTAPEIVEVFPYPLPVEIEDEAATMDEVALDRALWRAGWDFVRTHPGRWAELALTKVRSFLWFRTNIGVKYEPAWTRYYRLLYGALMLFAVPGLILALRRWRYFALLYLVIAYNLAVYVFFHVQTRFRWVIEPYYLIFAAMTAAWLVRQLARARRPAVVTLTLVVLLGVIAHGDLLAQDEPSAPAQDRNDVEIFLPLVADGLLRPALRLGYSVTNGPLTRYPALPDLRAGWYIDWAVATAPDRPDDIEYVQVIRLHQRLACGLRYHSDRNACPYAEPLDYIFFPGADTITAAAQANPGALWLIGNEMDRRDWAYCIEWQGNHCKVIGYEGQDEMLPETYAVAYHELAQLVREADPTAQIAIGGVIQATPLRLAYLTTVWDEYLARYGEPMQVDVWNVHNFILQEQRNNYGADIPPGSSADQGEYVGSTRTHVDLAIFDRQIRAFRQWMKDRGQQEKPLIVSEFGVLYRNEVMGFPVFDATPVQAFMVDAFDYFLDTKDCTLGLAADECRLVQRWNWFSVDHSTEGFNPYGRLFAHDTLEMTSTGQRFQTYVAERQYVLAARGY